MACISIKKVSSYRQFCLNIIVSLYIYMSMYISYHSDYVNILEPIVVSLAAASDNAIPTKIQNTTRL